MNIYIVIRSGRKRVTGSERQTNGNACNTQTKRLKIVLPHKGAGTPLCSADRSFKEEKKENKI